MSRPGSGWPGRERLDRPDLVLLCDPTGAHALAHAGSRVRLGMIRDFVGEQGAETLGWNLTRRAGSHHIIGYGGTVDVETIEIISSERNIIGNLVGTYNDLAELMALTAQGKIELHTRTSPLDAVNDAMDDLDAGRLRGRGILVP